MTKKDVLDIVQKQFNRTEGNHIGKEQGYDGEAFEMYDEPIVGFSSASDDIYSKFKEPGIIGPDYLKPTEWLEDAKTVISIFFPMSERVKESNANQKDRASVEWAYARIEGQNFINACVKNIDKSLAESGIKTVAPSFDSRFAVKGIVSNWSERHAAFASGLGTFGMSRGLITRKGMAGRFGSIICSLDIEPDKRNYTEVYEYCIRCGACARRCPAQAFDSESGLKDNIKCAPFVIASKEYLAPRYGCGLCQTKVPCQNGIPKK